MSALYLLLVLPLVSAQTYHWGPCPTPKVQPGFNLQQVESKSLGGHQVSVLMMASGQQYLGRWYEIAKLPASFARGKCIEANYSFRKDGTIRVLNSQF